MTLLPLILDAAQPESDVLTTGWALGWSVP